MPDASRSAAILFVDICDSTPLYERSGDEAALDVISGTLDLLERIVREQGGDVVRAKGDDLLCTFAEPAAALDAAVDMMQAVARADMSIRVGMNHGALIEARGDIFGDAVNLAARMLSMAKPGEMLSTDALVAMLPESERGRLTRIGRQSVKGKEAPIPVYSLVHDDGESTQFVRPDTLTEFREPKKAKTTLVLEYRTERWVLRPGDPDLRLGRSPRSDLIVDESSVSREHATIRIAPGRVSFVDHSSAGSWIGGAAGEDIIAVKRESVPLTGDGVIFLGYPPDDEHEPPCIGFSISGVEAPSARALPATQLRAGVPGARREERVEVDGVKVQVFKGENATGLRAHVTNISYRGAMLVSEHRLGERDEQFFMLLNRDGASVTCDVRFVTRADGEPGGDYAHGVMFTEVDDVARRAIEDVLARQQALD